MKKLIPIFILLIAFIVVGCGKTEAEKTAPDATKAASSDPKGAPGDSKAAPGDSKGAPGDSKAALGDSKAAPGDSKAAPGDSKAAPGDSKAALGALPTPKDVCTKMAGLMKASDDKIAKKMAEDPEGEKQCLTSLEGMQKGDAAKYKEIATCVVASNDFKVAMNCGRGEPKNAPEVVASEETKAACSKISGLMKASDDEVAKKLANDPSGDRECAKSLEGLKSADKAKYAEVVECVQASTDFKVAMNCGRGDKSKGGEVEVTPEPVEAAPAVVVDPVIAGVCDKIIGLAKMDEKAKLMFHHEADVKKFRGMCISGGTEEKAKDGAKFDAQVTCINAAADFKAAGACMK